MVLSLMFAATGCGNNNEPAANQSPTCSITSPFDNAYFSTDENITIVVVSDDKDGTVAEVQLYVDNVGYSAKQAFPYNFTINAGELQPGSHTLKAVAKDDKGAQGESSVNITVNLPNAESPDFVSFSDGKIPATWQTTAWVIDNTVGYDDIYSLKATAANVAVVTSKTCNSTINFIEFYIRNGSVNFFIDGTNVKDCVASNGWTKFGFYVSAGLHTLKWQSVSSLANLDAIRFKNETQLVVGTYFQGGIIAYLDNTNQHGIIAAPNDQSYGIQWYNGDYIVTGAIGTAIGTGQTNTTAIVLAQGEGDYAAKLCDDLVLNGYSDWFLPSKDELNMLYKNRNLIGGFDMTSGIYWSSSEDYFNNATILYYAWNQLFYDGGQYNYYKGNAYRVRAVRAF